MNRNNGIDLFRIIGAFTIIILHITYFTISQDILAQIRLLARWVVPFFFLVSGYFFRMNYLKAGDAAFTKSIKRLVVVFIVSNLIYLPLIIRTLLAENQSILSLVTFQTLTSGVYFHLWFIGSMIFGYLILWTFLSFRLNFVLMIGSIIILALALLCDSYDIVFGMKIDYDPVRYLISIPFLYAGYYLAEKKIHEIPRLKAIALLIIALGILLQVLEAHWFWKHYAYPPFSHQFLFGTLVLTLGVFFFALSLAIGENIFSTFGRKYSLLIYLYQIPVVYLYEILVRNFFPRSAGFLFNISPLFVFFITLLIIWLLETRFTTFFQLLNGSIPDRPWKIRDRR
jgi:surface polysaccharide O-acyltransferase-like enzyme